ncbi:MAG TPA: nucleoside diphosphate kinase regulator [Thermoanaerobaculia bacterium]|jgi:regulator of nucleoside diphosphate kinase|nr:nucleoside diphosphate kinase regulator [Thermoanaerobaculia bacterium]
MTDSQLYLTRADYQRLNDVLRATLLERREDVGDLTRLQDEIRRAKIVEPAEIPGDVITMNSRVRLRDLDSGEEMEVSLVYPSASDAAAKRISILAPIGTAILGYRKGDVVEWEVPAGMRRLKIEDVLYQPEASGHFSL